MILSDYLTDTARSIAFLSRLPVPSRFFEGHDGALSRTVCAFPLAGVLIALPPALTLAAALALHATPLLAAFLSIAVLLVVTGALHEDGLSDAADGLGGGRDREHALAIMKDSRIGSYGAVTIVVAIGMRAAALAQIASAVTPVAAAACLLGAAAASRALMVWHWSALPPARAGGVAASAGKPEPAARQVALMSGLLISLALLLPASSLFATIIALLAGILLTAGFTAHVRRKLGGHTGDTIGASQQIAEIAILVALAMAA
ncbi:adenosylcobinamide-GDP ribazoletransferase [Rhizobium sp. ACO-34A]|nr:adenosylcobinamide-GDP ribazoletransferase [Rhizobium sp. ACO-34A]ATN34711.1 adenosylcobinamide-GDP ribazoletransferase [Rhizobium sp. ACO-34A]